MKNTVYGVGINDLPRGSTRVNKTKFKHFYNVWRGMLYRCYLGVISDPTYTGCTVCDEWLYLSNFKDWYDRQYVEEGWQLDKDILVPNNKVYSPETCRFVPKRLNLLLTSNTKRRGDCLLGVHKVFTKNTLEITYKSSCRLGNKKSEQKVFYSETEAHNHWRSTKAKVIEVVIKEIWTDYPKLDKKLKDSFLLIINNLRDLDKPISDFYK